MRSLGNETLFRTYSLTKNTRFAALSDVFSPETGRMRAHNKRRSLRRPNLQGTGARLFLDKTFLLWHLLLAAALFAIGYFSSGLQMACSLVVWGMFVRLCLVLHATWLVNSASHMWGYRNYTTTDQSRNNWWVALITYGEGWHNNHHAFPRMAAHGHRWWEIDVTFIAIRCLQAVGLAWDVVDYKSGSEKLKRARAKKGA